MDTDDAIAWIRRQRQAFAHGHEALETLYNVGRETSLKPMESKTDADPIYPAMVVNARQKMNYQLKRATANRLAMDMVIGVTEPVKQVREHWPEDPEPTIRVLRLVRNGVAHGNEVSYGRSDPRPKTEWQGFEFTEDMEGEQLFSQPAEFMWGTESVEMSEGYLEAGDAQALVTDVLEILVEESETFDEENIVGLSSDTHGKWESA